MSAFHKNRIEVPLEVRTAVLALGPRDLACATLGISHSTWSDLVDPNATLQPQTLERVRAALKEHHENVA